MKTFLMTALVFGFITSAATVVQAESMEDIANSSLNRGSEGLGAPTGAVTSQTQNNATDEVQTFKNNLGALCNQRPQMQANEDAALIAFNNTCKALGYPW